MNDNYLKEHASQFNEAVTALIELEGMKYKNEDVVYIEYIKGRPHSVITGKSDKLWMSSFDFEIDCDDDDHVMFFESGGGGSALELSIPKYTDEAKDSCCFWADPRVTITSEVNIKRIDKPLLVNGNSNPFTESREVLELIYCKFCDKFLDEERCEHLTYDDEGNTIYKNGDQHD